MKILEVVYERWTTAWLSDHKWRKRLLRKNNNTKNHICNVEDDNQGDEKTYKAMPNRNKMLQIIISSPVKAEELYDWAIMSKKLDWGVYREFAWITQTIIWKLTCKRYSKNNLEFYLVFPAARCCTKLSPAGGKTKNERTSLQRVFVAALNILCMIQQSVIETSEGEKSRGFNSEETASFAKPSAQERSNVMR